MRHLLTVILLLVLSSINTQTLIAQEVWLTSIAWNAEGTQIAVSDTLGQIHFYDQSGDALKTVKLKDTPISMLSWYEDDTKSWIAHSGYEDQALYIYDVQREASVQTLSHATSNGISALIWIKNGTQLVSSSSEIDAINAAILWDVETGEKLAINTYGDINDLSWNPRHLLIAHAGWAHIWLRDDLTLEELGSIEWQDQVGEGNGFYPIRLAWHPNGRVLASGYMNGAVSLWSETTGLLFLSEGFDMSEEPEYATRILDIAFSPDGNRLTTVRSNGEVIVWDWQAKKIVVRFHLPNTDVFYDTALSPDTSHVAFIDEDTKRLVISKVPAS